MTVRLAEAAVADLVSILSHAQRESPTTAGALSRRIGEVFSTLDQFPHSGRKTSQPGIRYINAHPYPYLIFYRAMSNGVRVLAIRHGARNPRTMPARP